MHSSPGTRYSSPPSRGLTSTAFASAPMFTRQRRKSISSAMLWKQSSLMPEGISRGARSGAIHAGSFAPPEERLRSGCITGPVEAIFFTLSHYHKVGAFQLSRFSMAQCQAVPRAKTQPQSDYAQRIDRVIDYLRANLHRPVKLAELANVACFSEFHFHRIFIAVSGETLNNFTNRLRLEKAARLLR